MLEHIGNIMQVDIEEEMKKSYIDYAMSVIVGRALPDVRDGLKPVHRRILYAMNELGLSPEKPHRKSARIVGDVLGKYHPHGDSSVYEAMVRMAQDFSTRYLLVDGHGNFGSVDGDGAAAMRYTEARLSKLAVELLRDIGKETVDYAPNFDETLKEPVVLPSRYPNLLVNGSNGIAVGMATSIPPHNLGEVIDATVKLIDDEEATVEDLIKIVKGPDFPTGATIMGKESIKEAYRTGQGRVVVRSKVEIEQTAKGKTQIIVNEIPYQVNKAKVIEKIAELVRDKKIEGISDLRDESDRTGMRIVIEIKRDANANVVLNKLYKHTQLQDTFSIIMIALVDGQPKILNLYEMIYHYLGHQKDVIRRRTEYDLAKAEDRAHILEGLKIALDNIDEVIQLIRSSPNVQTAKEGLMSRFKLSEKQSQAILDMRLQRLTGLEREKIEEEYEELIKMINHFREILANERLLLSIIKEELLEIKDKYNDDRRTIIAAAADEIDMEDLIDEEDVAITLTHFGYVKRLPSNTYKSQRRGGRGVAGHSTREEDFVEHLFITSTHNYIVFFTNLGRAYRLKAYEIPEAKRQAKGTAIVNLLQLQPNEKVTAVIPIKEFEDNKFLILATKTGIIKKTELSQFDTSRKSGIVAISLRDDDELISVKLTDGETEIIMATRDGMAIRFNEKDVRDMGRSAMGVKGMSLDEGDYVVAMELVEKDSDLLIVSEYGFGKRTSLDEYRIQSRGGKGLITYNTKDKTGMVVGAKVVNDQDEVMLISTDGVIIRLEVKGISRMGRNTQGVTLMKVRQDTNIVSIAKVAQEFEEENE
ncbi:DNA gyrase subunit A [Geosporobacter ferrireducens]|uniref:DNA gyrase subunit A n=1 Tax=Geosporobacter ferrireducens TaxID=1424294 RepID=A0A1D8GHR8_9FIRM|nr:DNA gyrase subunit A [Geosporobacter ferrireducens]AOT70455.1 DNA gyrase subunit A [Geosporobacter ferrireducens]MTI57200.1 DNA gyrase subunit A [Geosporobacter ferrireducens]